MIMKKAQKKHESDVEEELKLAEISIKIQYLVQDVKSHNIKINALLPASVTTVFDLARAKAPIPCDIGKCIISVKDESLQHEMILQSDEMIAKPMMITINVPQAPKDSFSLSKVCLVGDV